MEVVVSVEELSESLSMIHLEEHKEDRCREHGVCVAQGLVVFSVLEAVMALQEELQRQRVVKDWIGDFRN